MTGDMDMHHHNLTFDNGHDVRNNAQSVINNDDDCNVRIIDDRGWWPDDWQDIRNNNRATDLIGEVSEQNDRHESRDC